MKERLAFILAALFLAGCATVGNKIETKNVQQIKEGVTTESEVLQILGQPSMKTMGSDGKVILLYQYAKVKNRAENFIPVVNLFSQTMDMRQQMLTVLIGNDGKVEKYTMSDSDTAIKSGLLS